MKHVCRCKDCKAAKRKGLILGSRVTGFWVGNWSASGKPEYYFGKVSDYVPYRKFSKGRRRKEKAWRYNNEE